MKQSNDKKKEDFQTLKQGSLQCPCHKKPMHFHVIGTMRLKRSHDGKMIYDAKCPETGEHFYVDAPSDPIDKKLR